MMTDYFHRDARDFQWQLMDALSDGRLAYARYEFSYVSKLPGAEGRAAGFSDARIAKSVRRWAKA